MRPLSEVAASLGLQPEDVIQWGRDRAKVDVRALARPRTRPGHGKLVLVSAITPTPAGEGKTTTSIGLAQGLAQLGQSVCLALRQPSLGPCLGMKGGATGGGKASLFPIDAIDLHFTGDFHAVAAAHNLLAAMVDNHLHFGNKLGIDPRRVTWRRVVDMNDRALRNIVLGLGGAAEGVPREGGFDIVAASEVMAILCLATDFDDLRARIDRTVIGVTFDKRPVTARDLKATGAMLALLKDAIHPNLVQTVDGVPALVHGGPFANIAHGCNSLLATRLALHQADWVITEAGFAFDLGGEKFLDIKAQQGGLSVAAVLIVATVKALRMHGGVGLDSAADAEAVKRGLPNLARHLESIANFGLKPVVALNRFGTDTREELDVVRAFCAERGVAFAESDHFMRGGEGALELARVVCEVAAGDPPSIIPVQRPTDSPTEKIRAIVRQVYGGRDVVLSPAAKKDLAEIERQGWSRLPICMAKTQNSLSDDPSKRGRPEGFDVNVRRVQANTGAGFLVVLTGDIVRMPGLPEKPLAEQIDVIDGQIVGLK